MNLIYCYIFDCKWFNKRNHFLQILITIYANTAHVDIILFKLFDICQVIN